MHRESIYLTLVVKKLREKKNKKKTSQIQQKQKWRKTYSTRITGLTVNLTKPVKLHHGRTALEFIQPFQTLLLIFSQVLLCLNDRMLKSQSSFSLLRNLMKTSISPFIQSRTQCWLYPINLWWQSALLFPVLHSIKSELCLKRLRVPPLPPQYTKVFIVPRWWPLQSVHKFELCKIFNAPDMSC